MKVSHLLMGGAAALLAFAFSNCTKDENSNADGKVRFELTDAPIDDPDVQGVFVTVAAVKVDGQEIDGFMGKQTFDLKTYQNGQVKVIGEDNDLRAGTYSDVRLVLDYDQDATGASPGCYILFKNGTKQALKTASTTSNEIKATGTLDVAASQTTAAVFDFDLRKSIAYNNNGVYHFATDSELSSALRLTTRAQTGTIKGEVNDLFGQSGSKIVVYAYKKGTYNASEKQPQGASGIKFKNAVSSAIVGEGGNFTLAFLEAGDYELHFVGYDDANDDGKIEEKGMLVLDILGGLDLNSLRLDASATLQLDLTITGILPF